MTTLLYFLPFILAVGWLYAFQCHISDAWYNKILFVVLLAFMVYLVSWLAVLLAYWMTTDAKYGWRVPFINFSKETSCYF